MSTFISSLLSLLFLLSSLSYLLSLFSLFSPHSSLFPITYTLNTDHCHISCLNPSDAIKPSETKQKRGRGKKQKKTILMDPHPSLPSLSSLPFLFVEELQENVKEVTSCFSPSTLPPLSPPSLSASNRTFTFSLLSPLPSDHQHTASQQISSNATDCTQSTLSPLPSRPRLPPPLDFHSLLSRHQPWNQKWKRRERRGER